MTKKPLALVTALLAAGLSLPSVAQQQNTQQSQAQQPGMQTQQQGAGSSIRVGHDVVDAVDDVRENVADLIGSLRQSGPGMGVSNWKQSDSQLAKMEQQLTQQMEHKLDEKAERTDDYWKAWIRGEEYKVGVTKQVSELASNLDEVAKMLSGAKGQKMQEIDSADVANQVDDLQEAVEDLVQALQDSDGLNANKQQLQQAQQRLDTMEKELDRQADMAEEEWSTYAVGDQFNPGVQKNISELAQIMRSLFQQDA
ncbi:hypothetical protein [Stutzerimonas xanthomarina]|uniref:Uncharacterized protein n=2 Tax=Stutzerimonas xanthomarina TaxID=271420 RepID=A0A1M5T0A9_9GAMM|nr:hypothetical protein [Stutzerimonas xanthomarina]MCP9339900.1 hypothetical protein [Stutzerimonas xanthomarina]SEH58199.1 hypothetical protein SAMN05216535_0652 [Stutzerimonas xanthomarina]SHH44166.1 hypothetical protein SAMN02744645_3697 [Stutzerimonas xanthomarina DSM 18231]